jgi:hypothetical protein
MFFELARNPTFAYDIYFMNRSGIAYFLLPLSGVRIYVSDIASTGSAFLGSQLGGFAKGIMWFLVSKRGFSHLYSVALPSDGAHGIIRFVLIVGPPTVESRGVAPQAT